MKVCRFKVLQVPGEYLCIFLFPCRYEAPGTQRYAASWAGVRYIRCVDGWVFVSEGWKEHKHHSSAKPATPIPSLNIQKSLLNHHRVKIIKNTSYVETCGATSPSLSTQLCSYQNPSRNLMQSRTLPFHLCPPSTCLRAKGGWEENTITKPATTSFPWSTQNLLRKKSCKPRD